MKVYSLPAELPAPGVDYAKFDLAKVQADEDAHMAALKAHLIQAGYTGARTGQIFSTPVADGCAQYMIADGGRSSFLIHLPYGDGYSSRDVQFLPKAEVYRRADSGARLAALFADRQKELSS